MDAKCTKCNTYWNVSVMVNLSEPYLCPKCRDKLKKESLRRRGRIPKVLLKNKNK